MNAGRGHGRGRTEEAPQVESAAEGRVLAALEEVVDGRLALLHVKQRLRKHLVGAVGHVALEARHLQGRTARQGDGSQQRKGEQDVRHTDSSELQAELHVRRTDRWTAARAGGKTRQPRTFYFTQF